MKRNISLVILMALTMGASAQQKDATQESAAPKTEVKEFNLAGPFAVTTPMAFDTVDVKGKAFDPQSLLTAVTHDVEATTTCPGGAPLPSLKDSRSVGVLSFYMNNTSFLEAKLNVKGPKNHKLFIDGEEASPDLKLAPEHHTIAIKYLAEPSDSDSISVTIVGNASERCDTDTQRLEALPTIDYTLSKKHPYMVHDLTDGRRVRGVSLSADGNYLVTSYQTTERGGNSRWDYELMAYQHKNSSWQLVRHLTKSVRWMPASTAWLEEEKEQGVRTLYKVDPATGDRTLWASGMPDGGYTVSPTEDYIIINVEDEGPKEDADVFEVLEMDDRQPNWRKRSYLVRHDVKTGVSQRITFSPRSQWLMDISQDGKKLLVGISYSRLEKRPTEVMDIYIMDAQTLKTDTVLCCEGFLGGAEFSPDGSQLLVKGTPEAFNRIGCQLPDNVTPSMTENELFLLDLITKNVTPLTKDFDPSVERMDWSDADGNIYFSAEDRDYVRLYQLNPKTGKIAQLPSNGDYIYRFDMASKATTLAWLSYNTMEPASAYVSSQPWSKSCFKLFDGRDALGDAEVGTCQDWNYTNSHGDTVYGRLYLPKDFNPAKKYPMIVYYYGGCSPTSRYFESPYAPQMWNSLGYVAYILQPSGATGFGQEWASRHVNTAGGAPAADGTVRGGSPAGDIIEGVKKLCDEKPFINRDKIGCMGASYGGFMTQYLQTVTDIFACAVSHAGISNHTSYWGEGYWGYNYSEVSMANSYPWSHRQLYVDQSPLFNADKIHTPLLLLHGNADTNVPLIESLQMFTALKLLGREVALVEVQGENHHILDYKKREKWLATQMAWFQRWLKDDPSWWNALYPKKNL
ncbi:MAG: S9 family peptidase [Prevotella sp.]|nr:S9 family peptidase [Prevotella sp.]